MSDIKNDYVWFETFKPVPNPHCDSGYLIDDVQYMFEIFGQDEAAVMAVVDDTPNKVWTLIEDDDGNQRIVAGFHYMNRMGYFITEEPYATGEEEFIVD